MRPVRLLALAALAAAACGRGPSSGPACPHDLALDREVKFEVLNSTTPEVIRHDLTLEGLAKYPGSETLGPGGKLEGLTVVRHELKYRTAVAVAPKLFGGPSCAWIEKLTIDLTPGPIEILIPSEYPEDGCEYEQILAHERTHEDTHRDALNDAAESMRRAFAKADFLPARGTPLAVADRAEADRRIEEMVDRVSKPVYAEFKQKLKDRQAVIDLPENYVWVSRRCRNWK